MGTQTRSGFFDASGTKIIKPFEVLKNKNSKIAPLIARLWFERAEKVMNQLDHLAMLLDFFEYMAIIADRFENEYRMQLENKGDYGLSKELHAFCELYQTYQPDYDAYDHKNS